MRNETDGTREYMIQTTEGTCRLFGRRLASRTAVVPFFHGTTARLAYTIYHTDGGPVVQEDVHWVGVKVTFVHSCTLGTRPDLVNGDEMPEAHLLLRSIWKEACAIEPSLRTGHPKTHFAG